MNVALDGSSFADATDVAGIKNILAAHMNVVRGSDAPDDVPYETAPTDLTQKATNYSLYLMTGLFLAFKDRQQQEKFVLTQPEILWG